jgi:hypothetical protein
MLLSQLFRIFWSVFFILASNQFIELLELTMPEFLLKARLRNYNFLNLILMKRKGIILSKLGIPKLAKTFISNEKKWAY